MCTVYNSGNLSVGVINDEIIKDNLSYKYKFRLQPSTLNETVFVDGDLSNNIFLSFPDILDFSTEETQYIYYSKDEDDILKGVRLDKNSEDLVCVNDDKNVKKCTVPKSHFKETKNGFYYTYHKNPLNELSIFYDVPPVKIQFESPGPEEFSRFNKFPMLLISLLLALSL